LAISDHVFDPENLWKKELYSWTTAEQEADVRLNKVLLTVGSTEQGKGLAMDLLTEAASLDEASLEARVNELFPTFRYAWTNPWATRLGPGDESYGNRLVKMVLRDDAWVAELSGGMIVRVVDRGGASIPLEEAALTPERIAALFFQRDAAAGGPFCGTFFGGNGGYREFIVGNESMLESWSLGTEEILSRLEVDIAVLLEYVAAVRSCPEVPAGDFNAEVVCRWGNSQDPYRESLALPSDAYIPTAENLYHLIATLQGDLFPPDPLEVMPP
jgi:hypothetical protein